MRPRRSIILGQAFSALLVLLGTPHGRAQDPVMVNPKTVHARLENNRMRVLEATLKPGQREQMHSHPSYVTYVIAGGIVRNHFPDGGSTESVLKTGDVLYREPLTHWAENIGRTSIHLIIVELKGPQTP